MNRENLMALARFHSSITYSFVNSDAGKKYKNDALAVDYYRLILTLLGQPADSEAMAGIARIYYNRGEYGTATREYQKILDQNPADIAGHAGLLETYIEIWRQNGDPRFVIEKHRQIQRLGLESDIPIFVLSKLAGFYIDLDSDDLRIRYQIDPVDAMSGLNLDDNAVNLLGLIFEASEKRDGQTIEGKTYAAGYYQRGRYLNVRKEYKRAVKQFQNAYQYDARFYPALNEIGNYYARILDFDRSKEYYLKAIESYEENYRSYGMQPEDEILMQYDRGMIYYNLASLIFFRYAGIEHRDLPVTNRIYPESTVHDEADDDRRLRLYEAAGYLEKALEVGLKNPEAKRETLFWLGWIPYIQGDFKEAMRRWSELDREYEESPVNANLNFGKANAAFHTEQYRTALGYYLKLRDELEAALKDSSPQDERQKMSYYLLYSVYNNLGAVYEAEFLEKREKGAPRKELEKLETKGLIHYMKAIEIARNAGFVPEKAMANRELAFRNSAERKPLIEDWLNPVVSEK
jgi:tetratricopeptide (TPR) repeat protein